MRSAGQLGESRGPATRQSTPQGRVSRTSPALVNTLRRTLRRRSVAVRETQPRGAPTPVDACRRARRVRPRALGPRVLTTRCPLQPTAVTERRATRETSRGRLSNLSAEPVQTGRLCRPSLKPSFVATVGERIGCSIVHQIALSSPLQGFALGNATSRTEPVGERDVSASNAD